MRFFAFRHRLSFHHLSLVCAFFSSLASLGFYSFFSSTSHPRSEWAVRFCLSYSNFITSTEINLSNYGNIVVQCIGRCMYRFECISGKPFCIHQLTDHFLVVLFGFIFSSLYFMDSGRLCCSLKMYIFHFVGINRTNLFQLAINCWY